VDYTKNNHPLLIMLYSDEAHPYGRGERLFEFMGITATAFMGTGLSALVCDPVGDYFYSIFFVNIPEQIFRTVVFYCFTNACLLQDRSKMNRGMKLLTCFVGRSGLVLGVLFTIIWTTFMVLYGILFIALGTTGGGCEGKTAGTLVGNTIFNIGQCTLYSHIDSPTLFSFICVVLLLALPYYFSDNEHISLYLFQHIFTCCVMMMFQIGSLGSFRCC
jgi:hypothetical protein